MRCKFLLVVSIFVLPVVLFADNKISSLEKADMIYQDKNGETFYLKELPSKINLEKFIEQLSPELRCKN